MIDNLLTAFTLDITGNKISLRFQMLSVILIQMLSFSEESGRKLGCILAETFCIIPSLRLSDTV